MYLAFRNGRSYTLRGVPEYHYYGLLNSSSPGWYFNAYLKGRY
jgi:KTSC domain